MERLREPPPPPPPDPAEELLREWPELGAFGVDWVKKWLDLRDRLVEIAKVMRKFPWIVDVVRQRPMKILHPYTVEVYVARDGSEVCLSLNPPNTFCAQNGAVREVRLELAFSRYETYENQVERGVPPQGPAGLHHGSKGIRKANLTVFPPLFICIENWRFKLSIILTPQRQAKVMTPGLSRHVTITSRL